MQPSDDSYWKVPAGLIRRTLPIRVVFIILFLVVIVAVSQGALSTRNLFFAFAVLFGTQFVAETVVAARLGYRRYAITELVLGLGTTLVWLGLALANVTTQK